MNKYCCEFVFTDDMTLHFYVDSDSIINAYLKAINKFNEMALNMLKVVYFNIEKV